MVDDLPDSLAGRRFHATASASVVERTFADAGLKVATNRVWRGGGVWRCSSWRTAIAAARLAWIPFGSSELASSESAPLKRSEKIESEIIGIFEEGTRSRFEGAMTGAAIDDDDDDEAASSQLRGSRMSATRDCRTPGSSSLSTRWRGAVVDRRTLRETRNGAVAAGRDLCTGERTMLLAAAGTGNAETVCESSARARARTKAERLSGEVEEYMIAVDKGGGVSSRKREREREPRSSNLKHSSSERVSHYVVSHLPSRDERGEMAGRCLPSPSPSLSRVRCGQRVTARAFSRPCHSLEGLVGAEGYVRLERGEKVSLPHMSFGLRWGNRRIGSSASAPRANLSAFSLPLST